MKPTMSIVSIIFLQLLAIATIKISLSRGVDHVGCIQSERQALLRFKHDVKDPSNRLASWAGDGDCCQWAGVICNNLTGNVVELHLRNPDLKDKASDAEYEAYESSKLGGKINPSLLDLKRLIHLDLSDNNFEGMQIPEFLGSMGTLRYLNLSRSGFIGMIPHQLGNLSDLQYLDLGTNSWGGLHVENFEWLSSLSLLEHLDLSYVNLSRVSDWLLVINKLPSLTVLQLSYCQLHHFTSLPIANFSSLAILDLSNNQFKNSNIPGWVFALGHLVFLNLRNGEFGGPIPEGLQNLISLRFLDLSSNDFNSSIPNWFSKFIGLETLSLSSTGVKGTIPAALGNLTSLQYLDLSYNNIEGKIPRSLGNLCNLRSMFMQYVKVKQEISEVLNIFSRCVLDGLVSLDLSNCQFFGHLTNQIRQLKNLDSLNLYDNSISGPIPSSLGELLSLRVVDLSNNKFNGTLSEIHFANLTRLSSLKVSGNALMLNVSPNWIPPFQLFSLNLGSCQVGPQLPSWLYTQRKLTYLDLSASGISGIISNRFWKFLSQCDYINLSQNQIYGMIPNLTEAVRIKSLDLSSNNFSGSLPLVSSNLFELSLSNNFLSGSILHFLCHKTDELKNLQILNLRSNNLSGEVSDCWMNFPHLSVLNLGNNKFTDSLPNSVGALTSLQSLNLRANNLSGIIPGSLQNCKALLVLDVGENGFTGNIPTWIGERLERMIILNLRSNKFQGLFPKELCQLSSLQILDLAHNNLSGVIPSCISNFSAMVTLNYSAPSYITYPSYSAGKFVEDTLIVMKGKALQYKTTLNLLRSMDLSENNFSGTIPTEVTHLEALGSLNLSHNNFTGRIPKNIGAMRSLESIDFSVNRLSGEIPQSISNLMFLSYLNLSTNQLTGRIPSSTQLQSFDASSFMGNELCGYPLPNQCPVSSTVLSNSGSGNDYHDGDEMYLLCASLALGFSWVFGVS